MADTRNATRAWALAAVLVTVCLAVYAPIAGNGFITMDDDLFIFKNPRVLEGMGSGSVRWALTSTEHWNWYPLTRLSHLADVSLFGAWAGGHHLASASLHAVASALLFAAIFLMTGGLWRSGAVAGLFALHPLNVQPVAWAAERSMVLGGLFFALTVLLWARHVRRPGTGSYLAAFTAFVLGLTAKPVLVTLPCVLLLLDVWPLARLGRPGNHPAAPERRRCLVEKIPFFLAAAASASVTLAVQRLGGAVQPAELYPAWVRLGNAAIAYWRYLGKILWPADLALLYPHPGTAIGPVPALAAALFLAGVTAVTLFAARVRPWLPVGWLWFLGTLVPMIGLVQVGDQALADRYAYLPSIGVFVAAVWLAADLPRRMAGCRLPRVAAVLALALFGAATRQALGHWRTAASLYAHTLAVTAANPRIENNLANELFRQGRLEAALPHYRRAVALQPLNFKARFNFALALDQSNQPVEAEMQYREALRLHPQSAEAHWHYAVLLERLGRTVPAQIEFREARRLGRGTSPARGAAREMTPARGELR